MDVLSDVLAAVRLTGAIFFDWHFSEPWVGESPSAEVIARRVMPEAEHVILFHIVLEGSCWIAVAGTEDYVRLVAGDVIILPKGDATVISSGRGHTGPDAPDLSIYDPPTTRALPLIFRHGGAGAGEAATWFAWFLLVAHARPFNPVLEALPQISDASAFRRQPDLDVQPDATRCPRKQSSPRRAVKAMLAKLAELTVRGGAAQVH